MIYMYSNCHVINYNANLYNKTLNLKIFNIFFPTKEFWELSLKSQIIWRYQFSYGFSIDMMYKWIMYDKDTEFHV